MLRPLEADDYITEGKKLLELLEASIRKYQNNLLTTAEIMEKLLAIARQVREVDGLAQGDTLDGK